MLFFFFFFFQAEDGIRDVAVTGVQTCALPILHGAHQVAHRLSTTTLPRRPERRTVRPARSGTTKSGASVGPRRASARRPPATASPSAPVTSRILRPRPPATPASR